MLWKIRRCKITIQELLIMSIESHVKKNPDGVLICKNSMRLRRDPPLEIQVLTVLRNYEKNIKKRKLEKVISCYTSDLEQKIFTKLYSVKNSNLELLAQLKDIQT